MLWNEFLVCQVFFPRIQVDFQPSIEPILVYNCIVLAIEAGVPYDPVYRICTLRLAWRHEKVHMLKYLVPAGACFLLTLGLSASVSMVCVSQLPV